MTTIRELTMPLSWPIAWRTSLKLVGWAPLLASIVGLMLGFWAIDSNPQAGFFEARVVEILLPFTVSLHIAFILSPADEPPLELLLACPRPIGWVIVERLAVVAFLNGGVALVATLYSLTLPNAGGLLSESSRWVAASVALGGVTLLLTLCSRYGVVGLLLALSLWLSLLLNGDGLVARWPWVQPFHLYLQPGDASWAEYVLNRGTLVLGGVALVAFALRVSRDAEHLLGLRARPTLASLVRTRAEGGARPAPARRDAILDDLG